MYFAPCGDSVEDGWNNLEGWSVVLSPLYKYFCSLSDVLSPFLHWKIWYMSYVMFPNTLGHSAYWHASLFSITVPVGSFLEASLVAHICLGLGTFFVARYRDYQYIKWWLFSSRVSIFFHRYKIGWWVKGLSIFSLTGLWIFSCLGCDPVCR